MAGGAVFEKIAPVQNDRFRIALSSVPPEYTFLSPVIFFFATPRLDNSTQNKTAVLHRAPRSRVTLLVGGIPCKTSFTQVLVAALDWQSRPIQQRAPLNSCLLRT